MINESVKYDKSYHFVASDINSQCKEELRTLVAKLFEDLLKLHMSGSLYAYITKANMDP